MKYQYPAVKHHHPAEAAFLAEICERPEDDAVRLIFADWLDENGNAAWAELIRVQIQTERKRRGPNGPVPEHSPWLAYDIAYQALRRREVDLLNTVPVAPAAVADVSDGWFVRRGFVYRVRLTLADWLRHGPEIVLAAPVTSVTLTDCRPDHVDREPGFPCWRPSRVLCRALGAVVNYHNTSEEADAEASRLAVGWARHEAGLPPLNASPAASRA